MDLLEGQFSAVLLHGKLRARGGARRRHLGTAQNLGQCPWVRFLPIMACILVCTSKPLEIIKCQKSVHDLDYKTIILHILSYFFFLFQITPTADIILEM